MTWAPTCERGQLAREIVALTCDNGGVTKDGPSGAQTPKTGASPTKEESTR